MSASVYIGDCLDVLPTLPAGSVQCVVTSPPYFGLRDYGVPPSSWPAVEFSPMPGLPPMTIPATDACFGLEPDPWAFVAHLVHVFREVRRVLADDGVCFVNLGDSYVGGGGFSPNSPSNLAGSKQTTSRGSIKGAAKSTPGLKPKDLIGIPWRFAFAAQADGWFLRQDVIWSKPNPMPESVRDRCTKAHEYLFLLTKRERYYWDAAAIAERGAERENFGNSRSKGDCEQRQDNARQDMTRREFRNKRSVWTIATQPYSGAHFATFPPALVEPCIKAGSRLDDLVLDPFGGSGTTASVAAYLGRRCSVIDVNPANKSLIEGRMDKRATPLFAEPAKPQQDTLL